MNKEVNNKAVLEDDRTNFFLIPRCPFALYIYIYI